MQSSVSEITCIVYYLTTFCIFFLYMNIAYIFQQVEGNLFYFYVFVHVGALRMCEAVDWIHLVQYKLHWWVFLDTVTKLRVL